MLFLWWPFLFHKRRYFSLLSNLDANLTHHFFVAILDTLLWPVWAGGVYVVRYLI
jgi:hypothetical protein